ncbi:hypothetical protein D9M71_68200 [compost metagenome]
MPVIIHRKNEKYQKVNVKAQNRIRSLCMICHLACMHNACILDAMMLTGKHPQ